MTLEEYYRDLGIPDSHWHIGREHPSLEDYALRLLADLPQARILEVGYQSGGFAVPVILEMQGRTDFEYLGIDSLGYGNSVDGTTIARYLRDQGVTGGYEFAVGDAGQYLKELPHRQFDLILVDHYKPLYARELLTIIRRRLTSPEGYILFHDILGEASGAWKDCTRVCNAYGYAWSIAREVPEGLALVRRNQEVQRIPLSQRLGLGMLDLKIRTAPMASRMRGAFRRHIRTRIRLPQ
jgi:predicted O-methyltransferase YrrM